MQVTVPLRPTGPPLNCEATTSIVQDVKQIENPLSKEVLSGKYAAGEAVVIDMRGGEIGFSKPQ